MPKAGNTGHLAPVDLHTWAAKSTEWEHGDYNQRLQLYLGLKKYRRLFLRLLAHAPRLLQEAGPLAFFFLSIHRISPCEEPSCVGNNCCLSSPMQNEAWEFLNSDFGLCQALFHSLASVTEENVYGEKSLSDQNRKWSQDYRFQLVKFLLRVSDAETKYRLYVDLRPSERGRILNSDRKLVGCLIKEMEMYHKDEVKKDALEPVVATPLTIKDLPEKQQVCVLGKNCQARLPTPITGQNEGAYRLGDIITRWRHCEHSMCSACLSTNWEGRCICVPLAREEGVWIEQEAENHGLGQF